MQCSRRQQQRRVHLRVPSRLSGGASAPCRGAQPTRADADVAGAALALPEYHVSLRRPCGH
eukprot:3645127-Alexandrium_andersonii.AAC.1